jgi:hypothetical protein
VLHALGASLSALTANENGGTPAACAALSGHEHCLRVLHELGLGETLSQPSPKGNTPAHWAAQEGHSGCLRVLHEFGVSLAMSNSYGGTPAHWAAAMGHGSCLRVLHEVAASAASAACTCPECGKVLKSAAGCSAHMQELLGTCPHARNMQGHGNKKKQTQSREGGGGASPRAASDAHGLLPLHLARRTDSLYLGTMPCRGPLPCAAEEYQRQRVELERIISGVDALLANDTRAGEVGHLVDLIASALQPPGQQIDDQEWEIQTERARPRGLEWAQNPHAGRSDREDFEFESSHQLLAGSPRFFEDVAGTLVQATWDLDHMDKWDVARLMKLGGVEAEVVAAAQQLLLGGQPAAHQVLQPGDARDRFVAHAAATAFGLTSSSEGADGTRHVVLRGPQRPASFPVPEPTAVSTG